MKCNVSSIAARGRIAYLAARFMNAKLLFKTVFIVALLFLLVLIGLKNQQMVDFALPPLLSKPQRQPAAIMYFAFFGVGIITGTILTAGGGKGGGGKSGK